MTTVDFHRSFAGALGGLSSLLVLAPLWAFELSHLHQVAFLAILNTLPKGSQICSDNLQGRAGRNVSGKCGEDLQVSASMGAMVEMAGTLVCCLSGAWLAQSKAFKVELALQAVTVTLQDRPLLATALDCAVGVALVIAAFDLSGGYYRYTGSCTTPNFLFKIF